MPPLSGYKKFQDAARLVSRSGQNRVLQVSLLILVAAGIAWIMVVYVPQRQSRTIDANVNGPEKPACKRSLQRQDSATCQNQWESDHEKHLNSLKQEILEHTEKPIYPWISPPQALPGPYDAMYYPLPAPSLNYETSSSLVSNMEGRHSASYTRLVPKSGTPVGEAILYGTMTTSTNGWRRSHWNVNGG